MKGGREGKGRGEGKGRAVPNLPPHQRTPRAPGAACVFVWLGDVPGRFYLLGPDASSLTTDWWRGDTSPGTLTAQTPAGCPPGGRLGIFLSNFNSPKTLRLDCTGSARHSPWVPLCLSDSGRCPLGFACLVAYDRLSCTCLVVSVVGHAFMLSSQAFI